MNRGIVRTFIPKTHHTQPTLENHARARLGASYPEAAWALRIPRTRFGLFAFAVTPPSKPGYVLVAREVNNEFIGGVARIENMSFDEWLSLAESAMLAAFRNALTAGAKKYAAERLHIPEQELFFRAIGDSNSGELQEIVLGHRQQRGNVIVKFNGGSPSHAELSA